MNFVETIDKALEEAVKKSLEGVDEFTLLFSGGLDSSLLARICMDLGFKPVLVSVYMKGSPDERVVKKSANLLGMEVVERVIFSNEIKELVSEVKLATKLNDSLNIAIGVPIYAALETSRYMGFKKAMIGQGADELFAGYHRYTKMQPHELEKVLKKDVESINIERDRALAEALNIKLLTPYLDRSFVGLVLEIPLEMKIKHGVRKYVLREVAKKRGLPGYVWDREKKAIQYSTGVDKVLRKTL